MSKATLDSAGFSPCGSTDFPAPNGGGKYSQFETTKENENMTLKVRPIGDRFLVEPIEEKEEKGKKGGIIIPDTAKEKPMESLVVAVGTGKTGDDGKKVFLEVKKGDHVLVNKYGGTEIKLEGKDYRIFNGEDILAVIDN